MQATTAKPITVTDATFDELVRNSEKPVLVDFWAEWCPPCRVLGATLEEVADEADDRFVVAKLDVDANPRTAAEFAISSLPTVVVLRNGEEAGRIIGAHPKEKYVAAATA